MRKKTSRSSSKEEQVCKRKGIVVLRASSLT